MQPKCSHKLYVHYTRVSKCLFNTTLYFKQAYFTWEKWVQYAYGVFLHCTECALIHGCFIQRYRSDPAMYSTLPAFIMKPDTLCSIYKSHKMLSQHNIVLLASVFYMEKVHTVCIRCVLALHKMCVEARLFYPTISQQSCHVQHTTCSHNEAGHSMFNIQESQNAFTTQHCTVSKCILLGKSAYSMHSVCSCIAQNVRCSTVVLSNDIAAILQCTAHYLQP